MSNEPTDDHNWQLLQKEIHKITGFDCSHYTDIFLKRRVQTRLMAQNISSYEEYINILDNNPKERNLLVIELTIHVTSFFRNKDAYDVFIAETMMELLKEKKENKQHSIKIWCAGCSSGEEPYSIAMILLEMLQDRINDFTVTILATDISPEVIEQAKKGIYQKDHLKEIPPEYIDKYFDKKAQYYFIKQEIKKLVIFEVADMLKDRPPAGTDIIFCRNTIIYFKNEFKEKLFQDFHKSLTKGGYLVLGMTEALSESANKMFNAVDNIHRIYKKE